MIYGYMCMDVKDFYITNTMYRAEYIRIHTSMIPKEVMNAYNLCYKVHNKSIFARVTKGMYKLPQTGRVAHDALLQHLAPYGYHPEETTPGLWKNGSQPITFTLVVDYFGVKYVVKNSPFT